MGEQRSRRLFGGFSFVFIYCWYIAYWRHFEDGPLVAALDPLAGTAKTLVSFAVIAGVAASLFLPWHRIVEQRRLLKLAVHLLACFPFFVLPLVAGAAPVVFMSLLGGFSIGAVMARSLYTMFFEAMDIHPAKVTVAGYIIIQLYVHLSDIVPLVAVPPLYYPLSAITLLAGISLSYLRLDGEEMERRRVLPENRLWLSDNWHVLAMIMLIQTCLTLYGILMVNHTTWRGSFGEALNIVPDVLMFLFLALFGKRLTLVGSLVAFLALYSGAIGAFSVFGINARIPMQLIMEPAYRIVDFLFVWLLSVVFYTYGRNQVRLKACLAVFFAARFAGIVGFEALFATLESTSAAPFFALLPAFITALLLPSAQRTLKNMEAQRAYAERQQEVNAPLPPERQDVVFAREILTQTLPEGITLTEDEQTALAYLIDGQDTDVAAYFTGMPTSRIHSLNASALEKFDVKSVHELMVKLGAARAGRQDRDNRKAVFEKYGLTEREREITSLLLSAEPAKNIAKALGVSQSTVNFHSQNLYRKLGIQSRAELFILFEKPISRTTEA
jgi:DNA-binding CsgD family transcriptional regulator